MSREWKAIFVGTERDDTFHPVIFKDFYLDDPVLKATLYITSAGLFEAYINGRRVGDEYLTPYRNTLSSGAQYYTFDITNYLNCGPNSDSNSVDIFLGKGWDNDVLGNRFAVKAELVIEVEKTRPAGVLPEEGQPVQGVDGGTYNDLSNELNKDLLPEDSSMFLNDGFVSEDPELLKEEADENVLFFVMEGSTKTDDDPEHEMDSDLSDEIDLEWIEENELELMRQSNTVRMAEAVAKPMDDFGMGLDEEAETEVPGELEIEWSEEDEAELLKEVEAELANNPDADWMDESEEDLSNESVEEWTDDIDDELQGAPDLSAENSVVWTESDEAELLKEVEAELANNPEADWMDESEENLSNESVEEWTDDIDDELQETPDLSPENNAVWTEEDEAELLKEVEAELTDQINDGWTDDADAELTDSIDSEWMDDETELSDEVATDLMDKVGAELMGEVEAEWNSEEEASAFEEHTGEEMTDAEEENAEAADAVPSFFATPETIGVTAPTVEGGAESEAEPTEEELIDAIAVDLEEEEEPFAKAETDHTEETPAENETVWGTQEEVPTVDKAELETQEEPVADESVFIAGYGSATEFAEEVSPAFAPDFEAEPELTEEELIDAIAVDLEEAEEAFEEEQTETAEAIPNFFATPEIAGATAPAFAENAEAETEQTEEAPPFAPNFDAEPELAPAFAENAEAETEQTEETPAFATDFEAEPELTEEELIDAIAVDLEEAEEVFAEEETEVSEEVPAADEAEWEAQEEPVADESVFIAGYGSSEDFAKETSPAFAPDFEAEPELTEEELIEAISADFDETEGFEPELKEEPFPAFSRAFESVEETPEPENDTVPIAAAGLAAVPFFASGLAGTSEAAEEVAEEKDAEAEEPLEAVAPTKFEEAAAVEEEISEEVTEEEVAAEEEISEDVTEEVAAEEETLEEAAPTEFEETAAVEEIDAEEAEQETAEAEPEVTEETIPTFAAAFGSAPEEDVLEKDVEEAIPAFAPTFETTLEEEIPADEAQEEIGVEEEIPEEVTEDETFAAEAPTEFEETAVEEEISEEVAAEEETLEEAAPTEFEEPAAVEEIDAEEAEQETAEAEIFAAFAPAFETTSEEEIPEDEVEEEAETEEEIPEEVKEEEPASEEIPEEEEPVEEVPEETVEEETIDEIPEEAAVEEAVSEEIPEEETEAEEEISEETTEEEAAVEEAASEEIPEEETEAEEEISEEITEEEVTAEEETLEEAVPTDFDEIAAAEDIEAEEAYQEAAEAAPEVTEEFEAAEAAPEAAESVEAEETASDLTKAAVPLAAAGLAAAPFVAAGLSGFGTEPENAEETVTEEIPEAEPFPAEETAATEISETELLPTEETAEETAEAEPFPTETIAAETIAAGIAEAEPVETETYTETIIIGTDETWGYYGSDIEMNDLSKGEVFNRLLWDEKENPEKNVVVLDIDVPLVERTSLPIKIQEFHPVKEIIYAKDGTPILDFGQQFTGFVTFDSMLPKGTEVKLTFADERNEDGTLSGGGGSFTYVSDGTPETVSPHFAYLTGRYVKAEGFGEDLKAEDFTACLLYAVMEQTGFIETGNQTANQLFADVLTGQKNDSVMIPETRTELDVSLFVPVACYNMNAEEFLKDYLRSLRTKEGFASRNAASIIWNLYRMFGDKSILEENYDLLKDFTDRMLEMKSGKDETFLFKPAQRKPSAVTEEDGTFTCSAAVYYNAKLISLAAKELEKEQEEFYYERLARKIRQAIMEEYFTLTGRFALDAQYAYATALRLGLYVEKDRMVEAFRKRIEIDGNKICCKEPEASWIGHVLTDCGLSELAYDLMLKGEGKLGTGTAWFLYAYTAGIKPLEPGFSEVEIAPVPDRSIGFCHASYRTKYGPIVSNWDLQENGALNFHFEIPEGITAKIVLPHYPVCAAGSNEMTVGSGSYDYAYVPQPAY